MLDKKKILEKERIDNIYDFLVDLHKQTDGGYVRLSATDLAKKHDIPTITPLIKAIVSLGIVNRNGGKVNTSYYWINRTGPTEIMARNLYIHIKASKQKIPNNKKDGLVPVKNSSRILVKNVNEKPPMGLVMKIVDDMHKEERSISMKRYADMYRVSEKIFDPLIQLGYLSESKFANKYDWIGPAPDKDLLDIMMENIYGSEEGVNNILKFLQKLDRLLKSGGQFAMTALMKECGVNIILGTVLSSYKYITVTSVSGKGNKKLYRKAYQWVPTQSLAIEVRDNMREYWKEMNTEYRSKNKKNTTAKMVVHVEPIEPIVQEKSKADIKNDLMVKRDELERQVAELNAKIEQVDWTLKLLDVK